MTSVIDISNRALQAIGLQKRIFSLTEDSAEAAAVNSVITELRDDLMRMAPWNFALKTANLQYISSAPGTPENVSAPTVLWQPGQPAPPWGYEYQYPEDCLRACWLIPATQTGFASGIPITTAVTGGAASFWQGPPVKFKIQTDTFYTVVSATVAAGGVGYQIGDIITLAIGPNTAAPIGAPAQLRVETVSGSAVATVSVVSSIYQSDPPQSGAYFAPQVNPQIQGSSTGLGTGASFNLTYSGPAPQRVILTNQEFAILTYVALVDDPNRMDTLFQRAWINILGATVCMNLIGDKALANARIAIANGAIETARVYDGNEGFTVNDVTPDWLRIRGIDFADSNWSGPYTGFDYGGLWPMYG